MEQHRNHVFELLREMERRFGHDFAAVTDHVKQAVA